MSNVKLIAGLGNPGKEYAGTRHNVGFDVLDKLAEELQIEVKQKKFNSLFGSADFADYKLILLKPQTYMNLSGAAIATACGFYKIDINDVIVVADDMALDPGRIRLRAKGSAGGHNGLKDIINKLGSDEFARLRIGIGKSPSPVYTGYVLGKPGQEEQSQLESSFSEAVKALRCWLRYGIDRAMNDYNS